MILFTSMIGLCVCPSLTVFFSLSLYIYIYIYEIEKLYKWFQMCYLVCFMIIIIIIIILIFLLVLVLVLLLIIIIYSFRVFHISVSWWLFCWSLSDSKSPQVSRTRLRILAVLSYAVVWIVSTRPPTSKSSRPFNNPLVIVLNAPITIGTIVTFMFHSFFSSLARSRYLSFFSLSFRFILWSAGTAKSTILQILFFFCWLLWGLVFWPRLGDPFVS